MGTQLCFGSSAQCPRPSEALTITVFIPGRHPPSHPPSSVSLCPGLPIYLPSSLINIFYHRTSHRLTCSIFYLFAYYLFSSYPQQSISSIKISNFRGFPRFCVGTLAVWPAVGVHRMFTDWKILIIYPINEQTCYLGSEIWVQSS